MEKTYSYKFNGTAYAIEGENIVDAIEQNFKFIAKRFGVGNVAGYNLERVWLTPSQGEGILHILARGDDSFIGFDPTVPAVETTVTIHSHQQEEISDHEFCISADAPRKKFNPFNDACIPTDNDGYLRGVIAGLLDEVDMKHTAMHDVVPVSENTDCRFPTLRQVRPDYYIEYLRGEVARHRPKGDAATSKLLSRVSELCARMVPGGDATHGNYYLGLYATRGYFLRAGKITALAAARNAAGITQAAAAKAAGISLRQWQYYESGESNLYDARHSAVEAIAAAVSTTPDKLTDGYTNRLVTDCSRDF